MLTLNVPQPVLQILERYHTNGFEAYVVGGCVRDALLGNTPSDWDLCTNALPRQTKALFADCILLATGEKHGTLTLLWEGVPYEITAFRTEGNYSDGRRPDRVKFGVSLRQDLARRDFTVNAMAYAPNTGIVDYFSGAKHLAEKRLICVGEPAQRFSEDALRIVRGLRFCATLGFTMDAAAQTAAYAQAVQLRNIAPQRLWNEWEKMLGGTALSQVFLHYFAILQAFLPAFARGTQERHIACCDALKKIPCAQTRLAVLYFFFGQDALHPLPVPHKLQNAALAIALQFVLPQASSVAARKMLAANGFPQAMQIAQAAEAVNSSEQARCNARAMQKMLQEQKNACCSLQSLAVTGNDLLALGLQGKAVGTMLHRLLEAVITQDGFNEKTILLQMVKQWQNDA